MIRNPESSIQTIAKDNAIIATRSVTLPSFFDLEKTQNIKFGTGLEFKSDGVLQQNTEPSAVVLPTIFGSQLQGPILLATGTVPSNVPFVDKRKLLDYYDTLDNIVVIADDTMTDNARNLASTYRINALFIVQLDPESKPKNDHDVLLLLNSANINAVTALAGPQSLVVVQIDDKYYFYRGLANREYLNTSGLAFGSDITTIIEATGMNSIIDPRVGRVINLENANTVILPTSGQLVQVQNLHKFFEEIPIHKVQDLQEDISAAASQLQMMLNQKDLKELSRALVSALSAKVNNATAPQRDAYIKFLTQEYKIDNPELVKQKNYMLGELRRKTKEVQEALEPAISSLANMMSSQTTSKRTHDLKRLVRQAQIQGNVDAVKSMTFDTLAGYLETHAADMGVMLLNIETMPYQQVLGNLTSAAIDARYVA